MPKIHIPVIGYHQGDRQMLVTAMSPVDLVRMVSKPEPWDPVKTSAHGNRPRDTAHLQGIVKYLEEEEEFVLGAAVLYLHSREATFTPQELKGITSDSDAAKIGTLAVDIGAKFDIGDGQHRIGAHEHITQTRDEDDPVLQRLSRSGQPMIIVIEDSSKRRAQDFTDLQRNVKTPSASLAQSMDRRQPINRELGDLIDNVPLLTDRVEYFKDNPGKLSAKLFSFKTIRYVTGVLLVGNGYRSPATMDKAVNAKLSDVSDGDSNAAKTMMSEFWSTLGELIRFADVVEGSVKAPEVREATYLTSAGVLYAIAYAVHMAHSANIPVKDAFKVLDTISFDRTSKTSEITASDTIFAGNLVDSETGKIQAGRAAWELAANELLAVIKSDPAVQNIPGANVAGSAGAVA
jgi:DGQHR domain-containing protein